MLLRRCCWPSVEGEEDEVAVGKETPLHGERDVVADREGNAEVCAAGRSWPLWWICEGAAPEKRLVVGSKEVLAG